MPVEPNVVTVCACYAAGPTGAALEEALQEAVEATASVGFVAGTPNPDGSCNYECIPSTGDPYLRDPTAAIKQVANIQGFVSRPLDFSDINPRALRRGIETLQLVLRAIETQRPVVIRGPDGTRLRGHAGVPQDTQT